MKTSPKKLRQIKEWAARNRDKRRATGRKYWHRNKNKIMLYRKTSFSRITMMICRIRKRCGEQGIIFKLTRADIVLPTHCPVLGIPLNFDFRSPNCTSVDRLKPELGYVKGNVIIVSAMANRVRSNATSDQIQKVADFYRGLGL